jgi:hypothetical protein
MNREKLLREEDYVAAAKALNCEVASIKAVTEVEAPKGGFLDDGRVTILFERHKFHRYSGGRFSSKYPDISNPTAGGYGPAGAHQYVRFSRAFALDAKAAMMSCSWGKFQIMGFNFKSAGFDSLDEFVEAMKESEGRQLLAFVEIVKSFSLTDELRRHDWAGFARGYNGANYKINRYDVKLAAAYKNHLKDSPRVTLPSTREEVVGASVLDMLDEDALAEPAIDDEAQAAHASESRSDEAQTQAAASQTVVATPTVVVEQAQPPKLEEDKPSGIKSHIAAALTFALAQLGAVWEWIHKGGTTVMLVLFIGGVVIGVVYVIARFWSRNQEKKRLHEAQQKAEDRALEITKLKMLSAMDKDKLTVEVTPQPLEAAAQTNASSE